MMIHTGKRVVASAALLFISVLLAGCASLPVASDPPNVQVVGVEPLPSQGLELRFALKLRVQNPNERDLAYDGLSVELDLDGRGVANGVSDVSGEIPRFSDTVLSVPVSISAFSALQEFLARMNRRGSEEAGLSEPIGYILNGKLGGAGASLGTEFSEAGEFDFFAARDALLGSQQ